MIHTGTKKVTGNGTTYISYNPLSHFCCRSRWLKTLIIEAVHVLQR